MNRCKTAASAKRNNFLPNALTALGIDNLAVRRISLRLLLQADDSSRGLLLIVV
ncbi:MAG: hypothetical protein ACR2LC_00185 [Pyrinomonadaceae bacterium]